MLEQLYPKVVPSQTRDSRATFSITVGTETYLLYLPHWQTDHIQKRVSQKLVPYELAMLQDMKQRLKPDSLVLDVGANVGNHSLFLAAVAQHNVLAFEPNRVLAEAMATSVELNGLQKRITILCVGAGSGSGHGQFKAEIPNNLGAQSLEVGLGDIPIVALDNVVTSKVDCMKIDIEGMELSALQGATRIIDTYKPMLYIECQTDGHLQTILSFVRPRGYKLIATFNATPTHLFVCE